MSTSSPRTWIAGTVVLSLVLVAAGWFLLIAPKRAEAAELREETVAAQDRNAQLEVRIAELKEQFAQLPQRKAELAAVRTAMPQEAELATLTRDLQRLAGEAGVTLMTITPTDASSLVAPGAAAPAPAATPAPAAEGATTTEGTDAAATDAAATDPAAAAAAGTTAAPAGLSQVPVVVGVIGPFDKATLFLQKVQEELDRDYLVDTLNVVAEEPAEAKDGKPTIVNGDVTMTLTGRVFVLAEDVTTGVAPATGVAGTSDN